MHVFCRRSWNSWGLFFIATSFCSCDRITSCKKDKTLWEHKRIKLLESHTHTHTHTHTRTNGHLKSINNTLYADDITHRSPFVDKYLCLFLKLLLSWCLMSSDVIWHIRDKLWPMPKHGSIRKVYACLAVTCHLHFWQNDRDFLRATVVTRGWNGYRNKSQHRKSTLEKKILPPFQQGFEPATFQSRVQCSNHWAIPAPLIFKDEKSCF